MSNTFMSLGSEHYTTVRQVQEVALALGLRLRAEIRWKKRRQAGTTLLNKGGDAAIFGDLGGFLDGVEKACEQTR